MLRVHFLVIYDPFKDRKWFWMLISRLTNLKKVQRCQGASQSSRFDERRTLWKYNENHNADRQVRWRARNVTFIAAGMYSIKVDPHVEDCGLSMWLRRHYYHYYCFSRGNIILFSLAERSSNSQSFSWSTGRAEPRS